MILSRQGIAATARAKFATIPVEVARERIMMMDKEPEALTPEMRHRQTNFDAKVQQVTHNIAAEDLWHIFYTQMKDAPAVDRFNVLRIASYHIERGLPSMRFIDDDDFNISINAARRAVFREAGTQKMRHVPKTDTPLTFIPV